MAYIKRTHPHLRGWLEETGQKTSVYKLLVSILEPINICINIRIDSMIEWEIYCLRLQKYLKIKKKSIKGNDKKRKTLSTFLGAAPWVWVRERTYSVMNPRTAQQMELSDKIHTLVVYTSDTTWCPFVNLLLEVADAATSQLKITLEAFKHVMGKKLIRTTQILRADICPNWSASPLKIEAPLSLLTSATTHRTTITYQNFLIHPQFVNLTLS